MYSRRVTWTRPNGSVPWVWEDPGVPPIERLNDVPGFIRYEDEGYSDASKTSHTMTYVWQSKTDWANYSSTPAYETLQAANQLLLDARNITRTVVEIVT